MQQFFLNIMMVQDFLVAENSLLTSSAWDGLAGGVWQGADQQ